MAAGNLDLTCFSESYEEAREKFRHAVSGAETFSASISGPEQDMDLTVDVAIFRPEKKRTLLLLSGVHGVEGFAGSAIQLDALRSGAFEDLRVVFVHVLNPYGMSKVRRANENNVDLNRNFLPTPQSYRGASDGFRGLYSLLHPETPYRGNGGFLLRAFYRILRDGLPRLREAVAAGQYEFPNGLFYGGASAQASTFFFRDEVKPRLADSDHLVCIDVHTGLGRKGDYVLLIEEEVDSEAHLRYARDWGSKIQPVLDKQGVAYQMTGTITGELRRDFAGRCDVVTLEIGTVPGVRVVQALRAENQANFWGGDVEGAKLQLLHAFCPADSRWKASVLEAGRATVARACKIL